MKAGVEYHKDLIKYLKNPKTAVGYLNAALEEGDPKLFLLALRNVAGAQGNMTRFAKKCKLSRASITNEYLNRLKGILKTHGKALKILLEKRKKEREL